MLYICKGFSTYLQEGCKQELVHSARGTKKARKQVPAKTYREKKGTNYSERTYIRSGHDVRSVQRVRYVYTLCVCVCLYSLSSHPVRQ